MKYLLTSKKRRDISHHTNSRKLLYAQIIGLSAQEKEKAKDIPPSTLYLSETKLILPKAVIISLFCIIFAMPEGVI